MRTSLLKISPIVGRVVAQVVESVPGALTEAAGLTKVAICAVENERKRIKAERALIQKLYAVHAETVKAEGELACTQEQVEAAVSRVAMPPQSPNEAKPQPVASVA